MKYASIDIETTGLDPLFHDTIEIGIVLDDLLDQKPLADLPKFHCYVLKNLYRGSPAALAMHPIIFKRIAERTKGYDYILADFVARDIKCFLGKYINMNNGERLTAAGKNFASFDRNFLLKLSQGDLIFDCLLHRSLDVGNLYLNIKSDKVIPGSVECMKRAGIAGEVAHTALEDALMVVKLIRHKYN